MSKREVLVLGATGNQGGSVARALMARGHTVCALVRDPSAKQAQSLQQQGARLVVGTFDESATLVKAMAGVDAVFAVTTPFGGGVEAEIAQGKAIVDAAAAAKVPHFVFSSVSDADQMTGIPHFDSKYEVERYLSSTSLNWTITAPVFFSDNLLFPWTLGTIAQGKFRQAMPVERKLQVVSVRDIGRFNAIVIERGQQYYGQRFNYAGDELSGSEIAAHLSHKLGRDVSAAEQPLEEVRAQSEDLALMFQWFEQKGYTADIDSLRREFAGVEWQTFDDWADDQDWKALLG